MLPAVTVEGAAMIIVIQVLFYTCVLYDVLGCMSVLSVLWVFVPAFGVLSKHVKCLFTVTGICEALLLPVCEAGAMKEIQY